MADKSIELIYSTQATDYAAGRAYSNPRFFSTPRSGVSKVLLVGDWPNIRAAYEAIGIPVERVDAEAVTEEPPTAHAPPALAAEIKAAFPADVILDRRDIEADLTALNVDFDPSWDDASLMKVRNEARAQRDAAVEIPADWQGLHWTRRVALAKRLQPHAPDIDAQSANDIIAAAAQAKA